METKQIIIIAILAIIICVLVGAIFGGLLNQNNEVIQINDLNIQQDEFGIYNLVGHITPLKDFQYLEARIIFYDENNTIIGTAPIAWNMNNVKAGTNIDVGNGLGAVCNGQPSYAVISFYDEVGGDNELINFTVTFNGNATNSTGDASSVSSSNNNNSNKYSDADLEAARAEGYSDGFSDAYDYDDDYYYDDDYSGGSVSSTSDSSSSSSSGSSSSGGSSGSSNVETTTAE